MLVLLFTMPLIKLPPLKLFGGKSEEATTEAVPSSNTFLGMMFVNHSVQAALWRAEENSVQTLGNSSLKTFEDDEDGLIQADQALQELGPGSEKVNEIAFGFDPQWVDDSGLLAERKPFIKSITDSLGLKPVGFVVVTDALVQHILAKDALASQVLVYIQDSTVYIYLLKQGKVAHQLSVGRSGDIVQDVVEGLARFSSELKGKDAYLPAKLVLASVVLSPGEMDDAQQQITDHDWSENHPFVQAPVVESMAALDVLRAVVEQGGAAVAEAKGLKGKIAEDFEPVTEEEASDAEDFGFQDVQKDIPSGDNFDAPEQQVTSFGVPVASPPVPEEKKVLSVSEDVRPAKKKSGFVLPAFVKNIASWYNNHPHKKIILGGVLGGLTAVVLTGVIWTAQTYRVALSLQLTERVITKDVDIIIDPTVAASNPARQILKASVESMEVEGQETLATTGVKLVGESAKGTITIFNKTKSPKTFEAGTRVTAGSLVFLLDESVEVASASDQGTSLDYAQKDVAVTANAIGSESNLGKDTALTIANFSTDTYSAVAKDAFSGGSSREVRVVSAEDRTTVLQQLRAKLIDDAGKKLTEKSGDGTYYIPTAVARVLEEEYDGAVGAEADSVGLTLRLSVSGVVYRSEDLRPILEEALKEDIPEGYQLVDEEPQLLTSSQEATSSTRVVLETSVTAKARPPFDQNQTIDSILGLSLRDVNRVLTERPEIEQASYELRPGLARLFVRSAPKSAERVLVEITNQGK